MTAHVAPDKGVDPDEAAGRLVQLSVRLAPDLRRAVADLAAEQGRSVTAFVVDVLEEAVRTERDPFVGLAADMVANLRAELARALESGAYVEGSETERS